MSFGGDDLFNVFESSNQTNGFEAQKRKANEEQPVIIEEKKSKQEDDEDELELKALLESLPQIETKQLDVVGCAHEVAYAEDYDLSDLELKPRSGPPAREYKFTLDPFQERSVMCLDNHQSVLVSAHTSAGKTVVAEYAISLALRDKQRVIYTTPIKALSNQKFRDLQEEFVDVGLMTGDVTINPSASCLVMTTEILRSMLYKGSEIMREVQWVVFDEIHYMRDSERGVVWEETIILLPDNVRYVFLSATIPNAKEFAQWICHLHKQPCNVVYTDYRPTPLQHYIFPCGGDGLHLIVNDKREFNDNEFENAMNVLRNAGDMAKGDARNRRNFRGAGTSGPSNIKKLIKYCHENSFLPLIVFSFSKKDVENNALEIQRQGGLDFTTENEKKLITEVFNNAMECLNEEDRALPQVTQVLPILKKGIGIHHGGLLPILKETIEILFSENLIKCLFATETFAMGVNMPAKTVIFTAHRKFDGKDFRPISGGEYIQMSGRAGRRGMDPKGIVILMIDDQITPAIAKQLLQGSADSLNSAFHLTYNMVLNLLRVEDINPEWLLSKSFYQFQHCNKVPKMITALKDLEKEKENVTVDNEEEASSYYRLRRQIELLGRQMNKIILSPKYCLPFINPGRLVKVRHGKNDFGWGIIMNFKKEKKDAEDEEYRVDVMVNCDKDTVKSTSTDVAKPAKDGVSGQMEVIGFSLNECLSSLSCIRLMIPQKLTGMDEKRKCHDQLKEIKRRYPDGLPLMDPIEDMHITDSKLNEIVKKIEAYEKRLFMHALHGKPETEKLLLQVDKKQKLLQEIKEKKKELKKARQVIQLDELKARKRVLRRLGYSTPADVIETKGRVACEISTADELLLTEMIFNGVFNTMTVEQCTALLSCLIFQEKGEMPKLTEELAQPLRTMQECARRIAKVSIECKLELDEEDYVSSFKPQLMDVVNAWCKGGSFSSIVELTDVYEGSIIRAMRRLEELLRDMCHAAKAIGNAELESKFAKGIELIKRDIVFAASLYL